MPLAHLVRARPRARQLILGIPELQLNDEAARRAHITRVGQAIRMGGAKQKLESSKGRERVRAALCAPIAAQSSVERGRLCDAATTSQSQGQSRSQSQAVGDTGCEQRGQRKASRALSSRKPRDKGLAGLVFVFPLLDPSAYPSLRLWPSRPLTLAEARTHAAKDSKRSHSLSLSSQCGDAVSRTCTTAGAMPARGTEEKRVREPLMP